MLIFGQLLTIQSFNCTYIINYTYIMQFTRATCLQLNRFYKENHDKARAKPSDLMFAATDESGQLCAVLRLLPYSHFLFLRSVFTLPDMRGQGIAGELIGFAIRTLRSTAQNDRTLGNQPLLADNFVNWDIYTLPTPLAQSLYVRLGFEYVDSEDIPSELGASFRRFKQTNNRSRIMVLPNRVR